MAYTHDIPFDESNRANRRRINPNVKSLQNNLIQTKALPKIGDLRFDPNAEDGDGDGLVQDNTPYERPSIIKPSLPRTSGLASLTGSSLFTSSGSWTRGLTDEEVAERVIPDNMADFMNMVQTMKAHTGDTNNFSMNAYATAMYPEATFDPKVIAEARKSLARALSDRPDWRDAVDNFGFPPILVIDDDDNEKPWAGLMIGSNAMMMTKSSIGKTSFSKRRGNKKGQELFAAITGAPRIPAIKQNVVGDGSSDDLLVHEWSHYLNYLAMTTAPDQSMREVASYLYGDTWGMPYFGYKPRGIQKLEQYFSDKKSGPSFFGMASPAEGEFDLPDDEDVPLVMSVYGTKSPVEFFAETGTSYFSPDKKQRDLTNDAAKELFEQILGRRGLRSQSQTPKRATGSALLGLTPEEIAERVVPRSWEDARDLVEEHWYQLATPEQMKLSQDEVRNIIDKAMKEIFENDAGWDNIDFHPDQVATLEAKLIDTFYNNPDYYEAVQRLGMPPVFFTSDKAKKVWPKGTLAAAMGDHFPMIAINPVEFERERLKGPRGNKRPLMASLFGGVGILGTKDMVVDPSYESTLVHEWGHYVNKLAAYIHPDEEVRKIGQAYFQMSYGDLTFLEDNDSAIFRYADDIMNAQLGGDVLDPEVPFILTHYGQTTPAETFAEGIAAMLSGDKRKRDLVSPGLQKDIRKILGLPEEEDSLDVIRAERRGLASHSSSARVISRNRRGTREFRGEWSPLNGSDWLKDATVEEIAEAVIPTSEDDAITMMAQLLCYGQIPADANEVRAMKAMAKDLLRSSFGPTAWDYSPSMRAMQKETLIKAMEESPGFEYLVRMYGMPPIIGVPDGSSAQMRAIYGDKVGSFHQPKGRFTMGATLQNLVIGMNYDADVMKFDLPSGFLDIQDMARLTGSATSMRSDGYSIVTGRRTTMMDNFGLSRADTLRHEYAHWFWYFHMGSPYTYGDSSARGVTYNLPDLGRGRNDRALFISKATGETVQQVLDRVNGLKWRFDEERITVRSQRDRIGRDLLALGYAMDDPTDPDAMMIAPHPDAPTRFGGNGGQDGTALWQATAGRFLQFINNPKSSDLWSSEDTALFDSELAKLQDAFTGTSEYSNYPLPMIRGVYANATAQETFAESLGLFLSPDDALFKRYATESVMDALAEGFNLSRTPNGGIIAPWGARNTGPRRGLSSRSANSTLLSRTLSTNDRLAISAKPDIDITPSTVTQKAPGVFSFSSGDDKWDFLIGEDMGKQWDTAYASWVSNGGQDRIRQASASLMGLSSMPSADRDESRGSMIDAFVTMSHISTNGEPTPSASYRALSLVNSDSEILNAEVGKPLSLPLTSFSPDREIHMEIRRQRTGVDDRTKGTGSTVIMRLAPNAQVVKPSKDHDRTFMNDNGDAVNDSREFLTQGQFKITGRQTLDDGTVLVDIEHTHVFDAEEGKLKRLRGLSSSSKVKLSRSETDIAKRAKEALQKDIDEKRAEIDELNELNRRLRLAMEELQATGSWQGEKYDIRINDQGKLPPVTATREQIEAQALKNGVTLDEEVADYVKEAEAAGYRRKYEIDQLQKKLDAAQENFDTVTKERSDNTFHMEELLAIPEIKEEILRRREEVLGLSYSDRDKRWSDPNDPDAYYVIHWGASQFVGGELDPARSRGVDGPIQAENTRSINLYTAKPYVEETTRLREVQETTKRVLADFAAEKDMNVGPPGRITSRERKILEDYNLGSAINDDGAIKWGEIKESLGDGYQEWLQKQVARIQEDLDKQEPRIARRERISAQLVADGYQYSSAYNARALTQGFAGYGGRYADEGAEIGAGASSGERAAKSPITGIHIFRVTPETATSLGGGEDHLIGKHKPIATLVAKNDGMSDTNPAVNAWEGWVDMAIQQDIQSRSGMASRVTNNTPEELTASIQQRVGGLQSRGTPLDPRGKTLEEIAKEIELTPDEEDILVQILPDVSKLKDIAVNPSLEGMREELIDSVRVTVGEDGVPFIYAMPHPLLAEEIPDKRDWSAVVRPKKETAEKVKALVEQMLKQAMGDDTLQDFYTRTTDGGDKYEEINKREDASKLLRYAFSEWSVELLKQITSKNPFDSENNEYIGGLVGGEMGGVPTFLQMWAQGIQDLNAPELNTFVGLDEFLNSHDVWGHVGTGRGFDRHGEWANMLAMFSLMDRWAKEKGISKQDLTLAKVSWFESLEYTRVNGEFKPTKEELQSRDKWWIHTYSYSIAPAFATNEQLEELISLIDDGNTHDTGRSRGLASASNAQKAEIVKNDIVRQASMRTGLASRATKASAKRITKNFKVNGKPRKKPENTQEFIRRAVPTSASDLMRIIEESPYTKGKKSKEEIFDLATRVMEIDWPAQEKLAAKLEKVLEDSPGFEELLGDYDIPLMLITKNGAGKSQFGYTDELYQRPDRWNHIEGEYMPQHGFIAFPARVVNQETVHNAVSDGPLPTDDIIRHELSHTIHAMAMARSRKARKAYQKDTEEFLAGLEYAIEVAEQSGADSFNMSSYSPLSPDDYALAGEISRYAQTKRSEYIAELLTHMMPGKKTKFVLPKDEHYAMLSEFLDIPVARLRELANKSSDSRDGFL
jgi:hypothetical protein